MYTNQKQSYITYTNYTHNKCQCKALPKMNMGIRNGAKCQSNGKIS